ncbi:hypothetical protein NMG60_11031191 [Bertholletia excelsa]
MNLGGIGAGGDNLSSSSSSLHQWRYAVSRRCRYLLDKSTPFVLHRWIASAVVASIYALRVYFVQGYYVITYALGIYILQLFILFLSPQVDPEIHDLVDGPTLPTLGSDEFRPFIRRLSEFKFWYCFTIAFCIAFLLTFVSAFDVPVFWPILLFYWMALFVSTMKRQIMHMVKYKYVPFTFGKQRYTGKKETSIEKTDVAAA